MSETMREWATGRIAQILSGLPVLGRLVAILVSVIEVLKLIEDSI